MKKITWKSFVIFIIISSVIVNIGNSLQISEEYSEKYPLGSSNSNSWSKIVKEGEYYSTSYCELVNGSIYFIGFINNYISVSKYNTSGIKEWELKLDDFYRISYVVDRDNNLFILGSFNLTLIKINSSGAVLFSKIFAIDTHPDDASLVLGENNSLAIVCHYFNYTNPYLGKLYIMKINNAGHLLWNTSYYVIDYNKYPQIVKDSEDNMYIYFWNNSMHNLAKFNGSGVIVWQMSLENRIEDLLVDSNDNLFIMGEQDASIGYIRKLNKTGDQIKETLIENFSDYYDKIWYFNDLLVFNRFSMSIFCYDLNLDLRWDFSLSDYITDHFLLETYLAKDSLGNVYVIQNNELGNINLVIINSTGEFLSRIIWGGIFVEKPLSLHIDLDNNIYFTCNWEYYNSWKNRFIYTILVKNPINGGTPPEPRRDLDERDFFLLSVLGIVCIISPIALISILRSNKKRTD